MQKPPESGGGVKPRDETPTRPNVFLVPSQSSARLPAHVTTAAKHPSLNPDLFSAQSSRRLSLQGADSVLDSQPSPPRETRDTEAQKTLIKQKQKV